MIIYSPLICASLVFFDVNSVFLYLWAKEGVIVVDGAYYIKDDKQEYA